MLDKKHDPRIKREVNRVFSKLQKKFISTRIEDFKLYLSDIHPEKYATNFRKFSKYEEFIVIYLMYSMGLYPETLCKIKFKDISEGILKHWGKCARC